MIKYNFGIECELSWDKFLCLETNLTKMYKVDFTDFSNLFHFIDTNKEHISKILFDGYEYILENGLLHNLYGPAKLRHKEKEKSEPFFGTTRWFFINGKLVSNEQENIRGCKNVNDFENNEIFFFRDNI